MQVTAPLRQGFMAQAMVTPHREHDQMKTLQGTAFFTSQADIIDCKVT
jgi:hypothetical protein